MSETKIGTCGRCGCDDVQINNYGTTGWRCWYCARISSSAPSYVSQAQHALEQRLVELVQPRLAPELVGVPADIAARWVKARDNVFAEESPAHIHEALEAANEMHAAVRAALTVAGWKG